MKVQFYNNKILFHNGKIALDPACCCDQISPSPSAGPSPWPPDQEAWCPCGDYPLSSAGSCKIEHFTDDLNGTKACGNLCHPPYYSGNIECSYSSLNDTYDLDIYPDTSGWYGEAILGTWAGGWTYGQPINDPGILVWKSTSCFPNYPVTLVYAWQIRCWYRWCWGTCPARDEWEIFDPTKTRGWVAIEIKAQEFGIGSPNHAGYTIYADNCYQPCTHVGICTGGSCTFTDGVKVTVSG